MSSLFPSANKADVVANVEAPPVVAKVDGQDAPAQTERTYSASDVEKIVKDRLTRERKKFEREFAPPKVETDEPTAAAETKVSPNVADDFKAKLAEERKRNREMAEKLNRFREDSLKAQVERKLNEHNCLDPEVVIEHFFGKKLVQSDEDGNLVVENATGDLDDLVRDYLARKPHLVRGTVTGGVGTRQPHPAAATAGHKGIDEMEAALGIIRTDKRKLFLR